MSENRSPMFIRPETVAGQENMIPCGVATYKEKNGYIIYMYILHIGKRT